MAEEPVGAAPKEKHPRQSFRRGRLNHVTAMRSFLSPLVEGAVRETDHRNGEEEPPGDRAVERHAWEPVELVRL